MASAMRRKKKGTLKSGKGGEGGTMKSRKQAIAIGLSEADKLAPKSRRKNSPPSSHSEVRGTPPPCSQRARSHPAVTTGTVKIRVENTSTNEPSEAEKIGALAEHGGVGWAIDNRRLVRAATASGAGCRRGPQG